MSALETTDSIPVHHIKTDIASKTPKQKEDEPNYFPPGEPHRCKRKADKKMMNLAENTEVVHNDDKLIIFVNCGRTAVSDNFQMDTLF